MDIIPAERIITAAWDQVFGGELLDKPMSSGLGLFFNVEISVQNFGYERDGSTHHPEWERTFFRSIQIVVTARHEVFVRKSSDHVSDLDQRKLALEEWENTSNHDSCWREDGLREIWQTLMEAHKHCWDHMPAEHSQSMVSMHKHCSVNTGVFSRGLIQLVRVRTESDQVKNGRRRMTNLSSAAFKLAVVETQEPAPA